MVAAAFELTLKRGDMSAFFPLRFTLGKNYKKLKIFFSYSPKYLEDAAENAALIRSAYAKYAPGFDGYPVGIRLSNHISVSLDAPCGYIGTAHRQANEQVFEFDASAASPGFRPFKIAAGEYVITLATNSIATDSVAVSVSAEACDA